MGNGRAPFSEIGKRAKPKVTSMKPFCSVPIVGFTCSLIFCLKSIDLLTKCYDRCDKGISLSIKGSTPMGLITGLADTKVSTTLTFDEVMPQTKAIVSFKVPDPKSGKLHVHYRGYHKLRTFIDAGIDLNRSPHLDFTGTVTYKDVLLGGSVGFATASESFTRYVAAIKFKSATLYLMDKGKRLFATYDVPSIYGSDKNKITAEFTHRFPSSENIITLKSAHVIDRYNTVKTKFSSNGRVSISCQHEWRPKSFITVSAKYNVMRTEVSPKWGLAMALNL